MPELPEVETIKLFLESKLTGQSITHLQVLTPKSFVGDPDLILKTTILAFSRHGKQLTVNLSGQLSLLIHLKMTGQLIYQGVLLGHPVKSSNSTRLIFTFSNGSKLYFNDQRKFGWIKLVNTADLPFHHQNYGLDILDPQFTSAYFYSRLQKTTRSIKTVLLDQTKFAGIGNIYANDSLWEAKINPTTPAAQLSRTNSNRLHRAIISIIHESINHGGSTAKDNKYLRPDGSPGAHQYHFRVYQRAGESCLRCGTAIHRLVLSGRSAFFCPSCQKT